MRLLTPATLLVLTSSAGAQCIDEFVFPGAHQDENGFGASVLLDGDVALVAEVGNDAVALGAGAAHIYERQAGAWTLASTLAPADLDAHASFPREMRLSGTTAFLSDTQWNSEQGRVFVYERGANGWTQTQVLTRGNTPFTRFGRRMSLDGDRAAILSDPSGEISIFERGAAGWAEVFVLPPDPNFSAYAADLSLSGERLVIGALNSSPDDNVLLVYEPDALGNWTETAQVRGTDADGSEFGGSISIDGERIVATQVSGDPPHLFELQAGQGWVETVLPLPDGNFARLGARGALDIEGDWIVAGHAFGLSHVLYWRRVGQTWSFHDLVERHGFGWGGFGQSTALSGTTVIAGAPQSFSPSGDRVGRAAFLSTSVATQVCASQPNSSGQSGVISLGGSLVISNDDSRLLASGLPANRSGLFFRGTQTIQVPFGDGFRCGGGQIARFGVQQTDAAGQAQRTLEFDPGSPGQLTPFQTFTFQFWFRDPMGPVGHGFNLTDAVEILFCP